MIYLVGFKQDIVVSFVDRALRRGTVSRDVIRTLHLEDIIGVRSDFNLMEIESVACADGNIAICKEDKIYLRPYSFEAAGRRGVMEGSLLESKVKIYQKFLLSRQTKLGQTSLRSDSNNNKLLHSVAFHDLLETPQWRGSNVILKENETVGFVVKSPSHVRTQVVTSAEFATRLADRSIPCAIIQRCIDGSPVRVTVIGYENIVAAAANGNGGTDYRYDGEQSFERLHLPPSIHEKVLAIAKRYGLPLCGLDLIREGSRWHFLEVNPEPGWAFLREEDNLEILRYILGYLQGAGLETLRGDDGLRAPTAVASRVDQLTRAYIPYPVDLQPSDFIARPGEDHPMWGGL